MNDPARPMLNEKALSHLHADLVSHLLNELEECCSLSTTPPPCPFCRTPNAYLLKRGGTRSNELPRFCCKDCNRMFTRRTRSIFSNINHRELLPAFIRQLPQQKSYRSAARELGCEWRLLWRWTEKIKAWLLAQEDTKRWVECIRLGQNRAHANGRRKRPPVAPLEPEIVRLRLAGHAIGTIATRLGLNHATVAKVIQYHNALAAGEVLPPRQKPGRPATITFSAAVIEEVEKRRAKGRKLTEIAQELNLPYGPLARQCRRERKKSARAILSPEK